MATCYRCKKETGLFGAFNKQTVRCGKCENEVNLALSGFRSAFINYCSDGILTGPEWNSLVGIMQHEGFSKQEAMAFIRNDAVNFVERSLVFASADGIISDEEDRAIQSLINGLEIPIHLSQPLMARLNRIKYLGNIRQGNIPQIRPSIQLEIGELCYLEVPATYNKVNLRNSVQISGRLLATNRKVFFLSPAGGSDVILKNIMRVMAQPNGVYLELSVKTGNGFYYVQDPSHVEAVIETLVKINNREILAGKSNRDVRKIPQDIKAAVWQRDNGKCVECGEAKYLELDHIIPWSKGGATSVNNLQLLCRGCNAKKSDRI